MIKAKNGHLNAICEKIEMEWTLDNGDTVTMTYTWDDMDKPFITAMDEFIIRKRNL